MIGLTPHFYKDGVEVFPQKSLFSMVTGQGIYGVYDQISFDVKVTNTGNTPIQNLQIDDADPLVFEQALPSTITYLGVDQSITFSSTKIYTSQFEEKTIDFWVKISGEDEYSQIKYEEKSSGGITFASYNPPAPSYWLDRDLDLTFRF